MLRCLYPVFRHIEIVWYWQFWFYSILCEHTWVLSLTSLSSIILCAQRPWIINTSTHTHIAYVMLCIELNKSKLPFINKQRNSRFSPHIYSKYQCTNTLLMNTNSSTSNVLNVPDMMLLLAVRTHPNGHSLSLWTICKLPTLWEIERQRVRRGHEEKRGWIHIHEGRNVKRGIVMKIDQSRAGEGDRELTERENDKKNEGAWTEEIRMEHKGSESAVKYKIKKPDGSLAIKRNVWHRSAEQTSCTLPGSEDHFFSQFSFLIR